MRKAARGELLEAFARLDGREADRELIALAKDCLAPEHADRPRRAGVVAERMTTYLSGVQERLRKAELERVKADARAEEERKRLKLALGLTAAVVALVVLGGGGATMYLKQRRAMPPTAARFATPESTSIYWDRKAAAAKIAVRPAAVALALAAALDEWATYRRWASPKDAIAWKRLVATVRAADPEPNRDRLRQLWSEPDRKAQRPALLKLAQGVDPQDWPPASLKLLADTLHDAGAKEAAADFLQRALLVHPGDVWLNYKLASLMAYYFHPPRMEEAIRYFSVAVAMRPEVSRDLSYVLEKQGNGDEAIVVQRALTRLRGEV